MWESGTLPLTLWTLCLSLAFNGTLVEMRLWNFLNIFLNIFCLWMIGLSHCEIIGQRLACNTCVSNLFNSFWVYRLRLFRPQLLSHLWMNSYIWNFYRIALFIAIGLECFQLMVGKAGEPKLLHWYTAVVLMLWHCNFVNS